MKLKQTPESNWWYMQFVSEIGLAVVIPLVLSALIGNIVDRQLGTRPAGTLLFLVLGVVLGIFNLVNIVKRIIVR